MSNKIELKAVLDSKGITRGVKEISSVIDSAFSSKGTDIFSSDTMSFLKGEAKSSIKSMTSSMGELRREATEIDRTLKDGIHTEVAKNKLIKDRLNITKQMGTTQRQLVDLQKKQRAAFPEQKQGMQKMFQNMGLGRDRGISGDLDRKNTHKPNAVKSGVGSAIGQVAGSTHSPVVNAAVGVGSAVAKGVGASAGLGLLGLPLAALAIAATAAGVAISRMSVAAEVYKSTLPQALKLEAFGSAVNKEGLRAGGALGFEAGESSQVQLDLAKSMGTADNKGHGASRMETTMIAARSMGVSPSQITGGAESLRQSGGTEAASSGMSKIISKAMSDAMDKSQASHFLEAAVGLLTSLDKNGMSNSDQMLNALAELTNDTSMSPEMASKSLRSMNDAISGSSGEANTFFQTAVSRGMEGASDSLLNTKAIVAQGLIGLDEGKTGGMLDGTKSGDKSMAFLKQAGLFSKDFTKDTAGAFLKQLDQLIGTGDSTENQGSKLDYVGKTFGTKNFGESAKILSILERLSTSTATDEDKRLLKDTAGDPVANWRKAVESQLKTIAGNTQTLRGRHSAVQEDLGEKSQAVLFNSLKELTIKMDQLIKPDVAAKAIKEPASKVSGFVEDLNSKIRDSTIGKALGMGSAEVPEAPFKDKQGMSQGRGITKQDYKDLLKMGTEPGQMGQTARDASNNIDAARQAQGLAPMLTLLEEQNILMKKNIELQQKIETKTRPKGKSNRPSR